MSDNNDISSRLIEFEDDKGNKIKTELADIIEFEGREYAILYSAEAGQNDEEREAVVMRLIEDGDEDYFETIEDDEEFEKVANYIQELQDTV